MHLCPSPLRIAFVQLPAPISMVRSVEIEPESIAAQSERVQMTRSRREIHFVLDLLRKTATVRSSSTRVIYNNINDFWFGFHPSPTGRHKALIQRNFSRNACSAVSYRPPLECDQDQRVGSPKVELPDRAWLPDSVCRTGMDELRTAVRAIRHHAMEPAHRLELRSHSPLRTSLYPAVVRRAFSVLQLAARGRTSREMAAELGISPRTVEVHRAD